jgi:uncharacterized RmlC-like cupin family protein
MKYLPVTIVGPERFDTGTAQTPGSQRQAALAPALGVETGLWGGIFIVDPAGDFIHVPKFVPHMEANASPDKPFRWVVVRSTAAPIVVNLPEDHWS